MIGWGEDTPVPGPTGINEKEMRELGIKPHWAGIIFMLALFVSTIYAVLMLYSDALGQEIPVEPDIQYHESWLPTTEGVEIWFVVDGLRVGFRHPQQGYPHPTKEHEPGSAWQDGRTIYLVTGDSEMPVLYQVEPMAIQYRTPFYPTWQPIIMKTWNHECECGG